eukprot:Colp12_sorted_trinity150504_noHs@25273
MPQLLYDKSGTMSVFRRSETLVVVKLAVSWELELHFLLESGLEIVELDDSLLREERTAQRGRECQTHATQQHSNGSLEPGVLDEGGCLLQAGHDERGDDHARGSHRNARRNHLSQRSSGGSSTCAHYLAVFRLDVDAILHFLLAHQRDIHTIRCCNRKQRNKSADNARGKRRAGADRFVEPKGSDYSSSGGAQGSKSELLSCHTHGSVTIRIVHNSVERLVHDLPKDHSGGGLVKCHHTSRDKHVARYLEGHTTQDEQLLSSLTVKSAVIQLFSCPNFLFRKILIFGSFAVVVNNILGVVQLRISGENG